MFITNNLAILAVTTLANKALALNTHRHGHQHVHEKKDLFLKTELVTVTDWVTVTVYDDGEAATVAPAVFVTANHAQGHSEHHAAVSSSVEVPAPVASAPSATTEVASAPASFDQVPAEAPSETVPAVAPPSAPVPTTLVTQVIAPSSSPAAVNTVPVIETPAKVIVPTPSAAPTTKASQPTTGTSAGSSALKRGLAYNDPNLLGGFVGAGSKVSWAYNWGQTNDMNTNIEFVPMLWGPGGDHAPTWNANANKAIAAGSKCLLSFNEPDNAGQANLSPAAARDGHIQYMNPFQGKARIGAPAITNSATDGEGISWLTQFIAACAGQCAIDFVPVHWYNTANTDDFFNHLRAVRDAVPGKPVWITEFAPFGSDDEINKFVATVVHTLDTDPEFSFVERYSYFMVSAGSLISSGTSLSVYGNTYAYA